MMVRLVVVLLIGAIAYADETFSPPLMGYVFDGRLRPVVGTPGAARVALPLEPGVEVERAAIAPGRDFGIVSAGGAESLQVLRVRAGFPGASDLEAEAETNHSTLPTISVIAGTAATFDLAVFSRAGSAAAVYSSLCSCIQVITGLPDAPALTRRIDVPTVAAMAVTDDGSTVAYSHIADTFASNGKQWPVLASSLAFSPDGRSLALLERGRKALSWIRDIPGAAELAAITSGDDVLIDPRAVWFAGASTLLVADARAVRAIDLATGQITSTDCPCEAAVVEPMAMKHVFRLSDVSHGAVWIFEQTDEGGRTMFVPVQPAEGEQ